MDEYLFISMAKLGADRVKAERERRAAAGEPVKVQRLPVRHRSGPSQVVVPSELARRLAMFSLLFAGALAAIGIGGGIAASLEKVPVGKVTISEVAAPATVAPVEVKVAQAQ
jgi:hypothetical protein